VTINVPNFESMHKPRFQPLEQCKMDICLSIFGLEGCEKLELQNINDQLGFKVDV
jgi:hypothetical protein